jgi:hypothetical protein
VKQPRWSETKLEAEEQVEIVSSWAAGKAPSPYLR